MPGIRQDGARVVEVIRLVRQLFHVAGAVATRLHADTGVTAPMRAVLESLARGGPATVPELARMRPVSRQHIQRSVDELLARGLAREEQNPAHKRSMRIALTPRGAELFAAMRARELQPVQRLAAGLPQGEVEATLKVLGELRERLQAMLAEPPAKQRRSR